MRGLKTLVSTTALLAGLALAPAQPQISIEVRAVIRDTEVRSVLPMDVYEESDLAQEVWDVAALEGRSWVSRGAAGWEEP